MIGKLKSALLLVFFTSAFVYADMASDSKVMLSKYFEAIKMYDTSKMADLMHPDALKQFRDCFDNAFNGSKSDLAKSEILPALEVQTIEDYKKLSDREAYKRFNDFIANSQPRLVELMKKSQFSIVTENIQGDISYFTYLLTLNIEGKTISKNVVQRLKINNGQWMLLLAEDAEASIAGIAARYN